MNSACSRSSGCRLPRTRDKSSVAPLTVIVPPQLDWRLNVQADTAYILIANIQRNSSEASARKGTGQVVRTGAVR
jgi:hypothetical protein